MTHMGVVRRRGLGFLVIEGVEHALGSETDEYIHHCLKKTKAIVKCTCSGGVIHVLYTTIVFLYCSITGITANSVHLRE